MEKYSIEAVYATQNKKINNKTLSLRKIIPVFFPALIVVLLYVILKDRGTDEQLLNNLLLIIYGFLIFGVFGAIVYLIYQRNQISRINKICANSTLFIADVSNIRYITRTRSGNKHRKRVTRKYYGFDVRFVCDDKEVVKTIATMFRQPIIDAIIEKQSIKILYSKTDDKVLLVDDVFAINPNLN